MLTLKKIAVTGGLAAGKSFVCHVFQKLGSYVVDTDQIVHQALCENNLLIQKVVKLLGPDVLSDGKISRVKVAQRVFTATEKLIALEAALYPIIIQEIQKQYVCAGVHGYSLFIVEVPLLFEKVWQDWYDVTIAVICDQARAVSRFCLRKGQTEQEYAMRMNRQLRIEEKAQKADYVIVNNGSLEDLERQVIALFSELNSVEDKK